MRSIVANLHCSRKDREGNYRRNRSALQNPAEIGTVCCNKFKRTFSSKNCVFTGKHDQKCRRSSDSELYCNFSSFCSLEGTKSIKKESKYMISNTLRLSRQHCNLKGRNLLKRGNTTTDIADKVILGKEISKSVNCFQNTQTFRVYDNLEFYNGANKYGKVPKKTLTLHTRFRSCVHQGSSGRHFCEHVAGHVTRKDL